jgi:hypothetical protein
MCSFDGKYDSEYLLSGVAGSLCLTELDGLAQGGGAVWCHGGINGRPDKVNLKITILKMVWG